MEAALRQLDAISKRDPKFMTGEVLMLRGDRNASETVKKPAKACLDYG